MDLFRGMEGAHGTHGPPDRDGLKWTIKRTAKTLREPVTEELWQQHLDGSRPLGVIPIMEDNCCYWGSIDVDQYDINLLDVIAAVEAQKLPLVPCRSKSGGLHLFLFLSTPQPAADVLAVLREIAASIGQGGSEIFPKQSQVLVERGDFGNWMVMPYYGGTFDGKLMEQVGLRRTGAEMLVQEFITTARQMQVDGDAFSALATKRKTAARAPVRPRRAGRPMGEDFEDGPPCLQHLAHQGVPSGGQNNTLLMMGIYYKMADPENWQQRLEEANQKYLRPPGSSQGLQGVIRQLAKKDYNYTCRTEPMKSFCDSAICRVRRFGVGDEGNFPPISGLSKLATDPVIWFVDVDGYRLEVSTDQLINYVKFHSVCVEQLGKCYQLMKQSDWLRVVANVMDTATTIEAPSDMSETERFREMLEEWLTNRQRGNTKEDLLLGRPWEDTDTQRYYFRMAYLQQFLTREGMRDVPRNRIGRRIEQMGGHHTNMTIKGKFINVWWVPTSLMSKTPEVDAPEVPQSPI